MQNVRTQKGANEGPKGIVQRSKRKHVRPQKGKGDAEVYTFKGPKGTDMGPKGKIMQRSKRKHVRPQKGKGDAEVYTFKGPKGTDMGPKGKTKDTKGSK